MRVAFGSARQLRWEWLEWTLVRTPGLPAAAVSVLADPAAAKAEDEAQQQEAHVRAAFTARLGRLRQEAGRPEAPGRADGGHLRRVARKIELGNPLSPAQAEALARCGDAAFAGQWSAALAEIASARARAESGFDAAVRRGAEHLRQRAADPLFAHATFLSSRAFYENGLTRHLAAGRAPELEDKRTRRALATAARYLRRLTVRCELTSFFGPIHFARLDVGQSLAVHHPAGGEVNVLVEPSTWVLDELSDRLSEVASHRRVPVRQPVLTPRDGALVRTTDGRAFGLPADALALWRHFDGRRTVAEAARAAGVDDARAAALVRVLKPALLPDRPAAHDLFAFERLLDRAAAAADPAPAPAHAPAHAPAPATVSADPAPATVSAGPAPTTDSVPAAGPASAAALTLTLARLRDESARLPWPQRRAPMLAAEGLVSDQDVASRRHEGEHYADRYVFHEDRTHPASGGTVLGGPVAGTLSKAFDSLFPLLLLHALTVREDARAALREYLGGRRQPLLTVLQATLPERHDRTAALRKAIEDLFPDRMSAGVIRLTSADVAHLVDRFAPTREQDDPWVSLPGPDVMACGDPASSGWLLSELHDDGSYLGGRVSRLHPDGEALRNAVARLVTDRLEPDTMAAVVSRRRNMFLVPEMPGWSIELSGRSVKDRQRVVPVSEAWVSADGAAVEFGGRRHRLYPGDIPATVHRALSLPAMNPLRLETGARTPRIMIDDTVLQRAAWRVAKPQLPGDYEGWRALRQLRRDYGLPERVFVRHPAEPKPLYLDFTDPYAVADVAALPAAEVIVTEMLPEPGQLWWQPDGELLCAELRTCVVVDVPGD
jgi:hypothetical protein